MCVCVCVYVRAQDEAYTRVCACARRTACTALRVCARTPPSTPTPCAHLNGMPGGRRRRLLDPSSTPPQYYFIPLRYRPLLRRRWRLRRVPVCVPWRRRPGNKTAVSVGRCVVSLAPARSADTPTRERARRAHARTVVPPPPPRRKGESVGEGAKTCYGRRRRAAAACLLPRGPCARGWTARGARLTIILFFCGRTRARPTTEYLLRRPRNHRVFHDRSSMSIRRGPPAERRGEHRPTRKPKLRNPRRRKSYLDFLRRQRKNVCSVP